MNQFFKKLEKSSEEAFKKNKTIKYTDLEINRKYKIHNAKILNTQYGKSVVIEIDDCLSLFLPPRFSKSIEEEDLPYLKNCDICYIGPQKGKFCETLMFTESEDIEEITTKLEATKIAEDL